MKRASKNHGDEDIKLPKSAMSECRRCGKNVIWATNEEQRKVALSHTMEVYSIIYPGPHDHYLTKRAKRSVYVNHTLICTGR